MSDFGNINGSEDDSRGIYGRCRGNVFTCPEYGIGLSITARVQNHNDTSPSTMACAIYNNQGQLMAYTEEKTFQALAGPVWETFNFVNPPQLVGGEDYLLVGWAEDTWGLSLRCTSTPGNWMRNHLEPYSYPNFPNPHRMTDFVEVTALIYCTYTDTPPDCVNPIGWTNDIICGDPSYGQDPTHQYQCSNGAWVDLGYSENCDTKEACVNPSGSHNQIICGNPNYSQDPTHQYQCIDGIWTDLGYSSNCVVICSDYTDQSACEAVGCYWWGDTCHGEPKEEAFPIWILLAIGISVAAVVGIGVVLKSKPKSL